MSQNQKILKYLEAGHYVSQMNASYLWDCWRVGARIFELRRQGYPIETEMVRTVKGKTYARYFIQK